MPLIFEVTSAWKSAYPDACVGVLVMQNVVNPALHPELERAKEELVEDLRARFAGQDRAALEALPVMQAYSAYYKRFKKTYHVLLQLESVVFKGRGLPSVAGLVEAMFMAEVKNLLLTAGHDLDALRPPLVLDVAKAEESYTLLRGQPQILKAGDMRIADNEGVVSSIIYGPDQRTQIRESTTGAVFTVYAPPGISAADVDRHLRDIEGYVRLFAPDASVTLLQVFGSA
jgi:DNA/RNA-binding domain of Phe-tRNA-synthetase-like protein